MKSRLVNSMILSALIALLTVITASAANFKWDGDGGAGNEQFAYQEDGKYINWAGDPASLPGKSDNLTLNQSGGLAIMDGDYTTDGAHSTISAEGGFTLRIPTNASWSVGQSAHTYLYLGQRTAEVGAIEITGGALTAENIYVGYELSTGLLSVVSGQAAFSNNLYVGANNTKMGPEGPVGIVTIHKDGILHCLSNGTKTVSIYLGNNAGIYTNDNIGILELLGGTVKADATRIQIYMGQSGGPQGIVRGYGNLENYPTQTDGNRPFLRLRRATFIADGHGANADLDLSDCDYKVELSYSNPTNGTYGFYATHKGRLLLPRARSTSDFKNRPHFLSGVNIYDGNKYDPEMVNSVVCSNVSYTGIAPYMGMAILATDRDGLTLPLPQQNIVGVWEFSSDNKLNSIARMTLRYDHTAVKAQHLQEESLRLFHFDGTSWNRLNATVNTDKKQIYITNYALDAGTQLFAVGTLRGSKSTVLIIK